MGNTVDGAPEREKILAELSQLRPWWHSPIDLGHGVVTGHRRKQRRFQRRLRLLGLPERLDGKRVLDIGTWDGYFALELERRGGIVHVVDLWDEEARAQFEYVLKIKKSKITSSRLDVHDLAPEAIGTFDFVLCAGVLYHTRYPLKALESIRSVMNPGATLILETVCMIPAVHGGFPSIAFFPGDKEANAKKQPWGISGAATVPWLLAATASVGFSRTDVIYTPSFIWAKKIGALLSNRPRGGRAILRCVA
ncbi:class I SAM-dependent methyltransferase [Acidiferrobacter sp.]|uniref:class I SAM-dependent methyltransferase n=1 Tax=Acidiferrobacter sp. TaxID=1872107 RepID=UPI002622F377|nr:class I SAM-dependent methyltransferase [Acidiferrobacter sp.]